MVVDGWWWGPGQFRADRCRLRPPPPPGSYRAGRAPAAERPPHGGRRRGEDLSVGRPLGDDVGRTRGGLSAVTLAKQLGASDRRVLAVLG